MSQEAIPGSATGFTYKNIMLGVIAVAEGVLSVFTVPIEFFLRPHFGSEYFSPVTPFFCYILLGILAVFHAVRIPYTTIGAGPERGGLIGLGTLLALFTVGCLIHSRRISKRMHYPDTERHSEWEEEALPVWAMLPKGKDWWTVRKFYEPLAVIALAGALWLPHILDTGAALFLALSAVCLGIKTRLSWYAAWSKIRSILNAQFMGPILQAIAAGIKGSEKQMQAAGMGGFEEILNRVPKETRQAVAAQMTRYAIPSDFAATISPVEVSEETHQRRMEEMDKTIAALERNRPKATT